MQAKTVLRALGIVPARYASTRFPGKLVADLGGKPIVVRTIEAAQQAATLAEVWLATDDSRISDVVHTFCPQVDTVFTSLECPSGSDRLVEALRSKKLIPPSAAQPTTSSTGLVLPMDFPYDVIVNVQGDEPLLNPTHIDLLVRCLADTPEADIATLVVPLDATTPHGEQLILDPNVVKCVVDHERYALYFSRAAIPCNVATTPSVDTTGRTTYLKHVGLYAYRPQALLTFVGSNPSSLELAESLEQLRALELGMRIKVVEVEAAESGIDTPEQLGRARLTVEGGVRWSTRV